MFKISKFSDNRTIHPSKVTDSTNHEIKNLHELADFIKLNVWNHFLYRNNYRLSTNFESTDLIVLDIDDGLTVEEAQEKFQEYRHIIATTKSHQKNKLKADGTIRSRACDRFRIILPLDRTITTEESYKLTLKAADFIIGNKSDQAAHDTARFWYPCEKIISINENGRYWYPRYPVTSEQQKDSLTHPGSKNLSQSNSERPVWIPEDIWDRIKSDVTNVYDNRVAMWCPFHPDRDGEDASPSAALWQDKLTFHCSSDHCQHRASYKELRHKYGLEPINNTSGLEWEDNTFGSLVEQRGGAVEEYLWQNCFLKGESNLIAAEPKIGKTSLVMDLLGKVLDNNPDAKVTWLFTETKIGNTLVKANQEFFKRHINRVKAPRLKDRGYNFNFAREDSQQFLKDYMQQARPDIVVLDALKDLCPADTSSNEFGRVLREVRDIICEDGKCTLLVIHHFGKEDSRYKKSFAQRLLGSTTILANVEEAYGLEATGEDGTGERRFYLARSNRVHDEEIAYRFVKVGDKFEFLPVNEDESKVDQAIQMLELLMSKHKDTGWFYIGEAHSLREEEFDFSEKTLYRAKDILDLKMEKKNGKNVWLFRPTQVPACTNKLPF